MSNDAFTGIVKVKCFPHRPDLENVYGNLLRPYLGKPVD